MMEMAAKQRLSFQSRVSLVLDSMQVIALAIVLHCVESIIRQRR